MCALHLFELEVGSGELWGRGAGGDRGKVMAEVPPHRVGYGPEPEVNQTEAIAARRVSAHPLAIEGKR